VARRSAALTRANFTLPKSRYLAHFFLDDVSAAGAIRPEHAGVPADRIPLCWGFYHLTSPESDGGGSDRQGRRKSKTEGDRRLPLKVALRKGEIAHLYAFQMEHDAARGECERYMHAALTALFDQAHDGPDEEPNTMALSNSML
jgi:hypothetical protein